MTTNAHPRTGLLKTTECFRIGYWNVKTVNQEIHPGKLNGVMRTLDKFHIDISGHSETRFTGFGSLNSENAGVGMALSSRAKKYLVNWEPINERILRARFASSQAKLKIIVVYAPTNETVDWTKDDFIAFCQMLLPKSIGITLLLCMGTLMIKLEVITPIPHLSLVSMDWVKSMIMAYVSLTSVQLMNLSSAHHGVNGYSNHQLVAKLKLKLKTIIKPQWSVKKFNVIKLQYPYVLQKYTSTLSNKFSVVRDELSIDNQWEKIVESLKEVVQKVVGYDRKKKKQWISKSTWDIIDQKAGVKILVDRHEHNTKYTREYLGDLKAHYKRFNKHVKTWTRNDQRVFLETMADQAKVATSRGDSRTVYAIKKELTGIFTASSTQPENNEGILLTQTDDINRRWMEHLTEALNHVSPITSLNISEETLFDFGMYSRPLLLSEHRHDIVTLCGDFNDKVGSDNSYTPSILGKHELGNINDNGVRFIDLCATHELIVGTSWFTHKQIHKYTWYSPDGVPRNEIDHILIAKHMRRCIEDVWTFRGVNDYSNHQLVAKLKLKLKTIIKPQWPVKKFNVIKLQYPYVLQKYTFTLSNKFSVVRDELSIDNQWEKIVESLKEVVQKVVGYDRKKKKQWISKSTWDIIDQKAGVKILVDRHEHNTKYTREYLGDLKAHYKRFNKHVKMWTRNDQRAFLETMADQPKVATRWGDTRTVYAMKKELAGIFTASSTQPENKEGILLTQTDDINRRWMEHLTEALNHVPPITSLNISKETLFDFGMYSRPLLLSEHRHDIVTLCGDFNDKVGSDNSYTPSILGKHGLGKINDNGVRFIDFCATHELIVGTSWFTHKQIHKYTWNSPDGVTRNEIDHILIAKHMRRCIEDVWTFRGVNGYSNHQLVAKLKLKLKTIIKPQWPVKKFNVIKLQYPYVLQKYTFTLSNKFSVEEKKRWISKSTWDIIDQNAGVKILVDRHEHNTKYTREYLGDLKAHYKRFNKHVKMCTRNDQRVFLETMADQAKVATRRGDTRTVYAMKKELAGIFTASSTQPENKEGILLTQTDDINRRWMEHLTEALNHVPPITSLNISEETLFDFGMYSRPLLLSEVKKSPE
ncbi:hypothetical protein QYM36_018999 [Artemia franciscana]|uniref:Endonuclease/exonuclease/phosphatase domain-containing protein n=1 Tax=Artemia franciscana TaxID=6661 RepID=A0AA88KZW0_ARTSF|nr:hypothetical protein QYM36_018999 [Artemia franciscana]